MGEAPPAPACSRVPRRASFIHPSIPSLGAALLSPGVPARQGASGSPGGGATASSAASPTPPAQQTTPTPAWPRLLALQAAAAAAADSGKPRSLPKSPREAAAAAAAAPAPPRGRARLQWGGRQAAKRPSGDLAGFALRNSPEGGRGWQPCAQKASGRPGEPGAVLSNQVRVGGSCAASGTRSERPVGAPGKVALPPPTPRGRPPEREEDSASIQLSRLDAREF